jgi:hypothetical protein
MSTTDLFMPEDLARILVEVLPGLIALTIPIFAMPVIFRLFKTVLGAGPVRMSKRERHELEVRELKKQVTELEAKRALESERAKLQLFPPRKIKEDHETRGECECVMCKPEGYALREVGLTPPSRPNLRNMQKYWDGMLEKKA